MTKKSPQGLGVTGNEVQLECSTCIESGSAGNETLLRFKSTVALGGIALEKPFGFMNLLGYQFFY